MKNFILAARPKTLLAGIVPPIVTYFYFHARTGNHAIPWVILCVAGALAIQLATNFFNDVIDFTKGADAKRVGPTRVSAAGLVDIKTVNLWAWSSVAAAGLIGIPIILRGGLPFVVLGLISLFLTFGYTGGKVSLAYRGLGELFVFLFFGLFSVLGSYYLYSLSIDSGAVVLAAIYGLLTTTFICINNLRDRDTDREVGKRTLATRMERKAYIGLTLLTIFLPYLLTIKFVGKGPLFIIGVGLVPAMILARITVRKSGADLNEGLKFSGIHLVVFSVLLCGIFAYGSFL
ncbi:MAG: 1,4-dihydroxy-2-naphthoate octaprenyltransferase [Bacteriovoracaceae bacterium]